MDTNQEARLSALLATHAAVLQPLLGHLWPVRPFKTEQFGPLTKYTLGELRPGVWAMLHLVTAPDAGPAHDHPCEMHSIGIKGSYVERRYGAAAPVDTLRAAGGHYVITPDTVHRIVDLPEGEAWTLVLAGPVVKEWQHYPELEARN